MGYSPWRVPHPRLLSLALTVALIATAPPTPAQATTGDPPGRWSPTSTSPVSNRYWHTATMFPDGRVLSAGGRFPESFVPTYRTEIYDPVADSWAGAARMNALRENHTATLLTEPGCASRCGQVLVTGGAGEVDTPFTPSSGPAAGSAELYDPGTGQWTLTAPLTDLRSNHTATLLRDGKVLLAGGLPGEVEGQGAVATDSAEVYDPATGLFTPTNGVMTRARADHTATLLPDGRVLLAGRIPNASIPDAASSAEIYDPTTRTFSRAESLKVGRRHHTATLLPNGEVLVTGGSPGGSSAELYNPANGEWTRTADMSVARSSHTATLLPNGEVLVAGGSDGLSAELYNPVTGTWRLTGDLATPVRRHTATLLTGGRVLAVGGSCTFFGQQHATCPWAQIYAGVPGVATNVTAIAGVGSATVSWAAAPDGGSPVSAYTVTSSPGGLTARVDGSSTTATVMGLTHGGTYTFTVTATNAVGTGPASEPSNAVTLPTVPGAPTGVTAIAGNASATVSWTPPPDGGSRILSYTVTSSPGGITATVGGSSTTATVTGLTNNVRYTFTVTATNAVGTGPASARSNQVTPLKRKK